MEDENSNAGQLWQGGRHAKKMTLTNQPCWSLSPLPFGALCLRPPLDNDGGGLGWCDDGPVALAGMAQADAAAAAAAVVAGGGWRNAELW